MRNGTLQLNAVMRLIDVLGITAVQTIAAEHDGDPVKYGKLELGQFEAVLNRLLASVPPEQRVEVLFALLHDEKRVSSLIIEDVIKLLFARTGRCIPQPSIKAAVCDPNRNYRFDSLPADFAINEVWLKRWQELFGQPISMELVERITAVKTKVSGDPRVAKLLAGPHFPIILPQLPSGDYGENLEGILLPVVQTAYEQAYPRRQFINHRAGELAKQITIVDPRHEKLVADLVNGPLPGILCFPLQGFSVQAQRQMVTLFPDYMSLAGPIEIGVGEALYPKQLSRDNNTPVKDCSAVQWRDSDCSLDFYANDGRLEYDSGARLGGANDDYSGGVFVRG